MTPKNKELLLKDLYARLQYGVKFKSDDEEDIREIHYIKDENVYIREYPNLPYWIDIIKPYLRPMSSMTEEERLYFHRNSAKVQILVNEEKIITKPFYGYTIHLFDWLNSHHFDYRNLIDKGLVLKAPKDMYQ